MVGKRRILYSSEYVGDLRRLRPFDRPVIQRTIANQLTVGADVPTRNRRPLRHGLPWCPDAAWQLRIGQFRVLYAFDSDTVRILRLLLKGSRTSAEMGQ